MFVTICEFLENSQHIFGTLTNSNELLRTHRNLLDLQEYDFRIRKCKVLHVTTIHKVSINFDFLEDSQELFFTLEDSMGLLETFRNL